MSFRSPLLFAAVAVVLLGCSKPEQGGTSAAPSAETAKTTPSATGAASAPTTAAGSAVAEKNAAPVTGDGGAATCGTKPLPDCPLQAWMKQNPNTAMNASDMPALAAALEKLVAMAPAGYTNWASIARDGAKAAKGGDASAAKASCRTCHDQYKQKYKNEMRTRAL